MGKYLITELREDYRATLLGFMVEISKWESVYYKKSMEDFNETVSGVELEDAMRADLAQIFYKYVMDEGRNYDRLENLACSFHSDYDLNNQLKVIGEEGDVISVGLKRTKGLSSSFQLVLASVGGACKIIRRDLEYNGKWQRTYI